MNLVLSELAKKDMRWWRTYYRQAFAAGSASAAVHLYKTFALLAENAHVGRPVEGYDLRKYPVPRTPFSLIYRARDDDIEIARIWDGRKDPDKLHAKP